MQLLFFVLVPTFFIFLFCLYVLGREDFILIRRNVFLEQLFNIAFGTLAVGIFAARLVYVLAHLDPVYLNPLVFLVFPYFPGLSLIGGVIGGSLFVLYIVHSAKFPLGRLFDFLLLSFMCATAAGYLLSLFFIPREIFYPHLFIGIVYVISFVLFTKGLYPRLLRGDIQDGTIALSSMMTISFLTILNAVVKNTKGIYFFLGSDEILAICLLLIAFALMIRIEFFPAKEKKI